MPGFNTYPLKSVPSTSDTVLILDVSATPPAAGQVKQTTVAGLGSVIGGGTPTLAQAATVYVAVGGSDSSTGLSWQTAFATIQHAVNSLPTVGGMQVGIVEVGYGTFASSSPVVISNTQVPWIRGRGMGQSYDPTNNLTSPQHPTIISNTGTGNAIEITGPTTYGPTGGVANYGVVVSDLAVVGNTSSGAGAKVKSTSFPTFRNVVFDIHGTWGQWFQECYGALMDNCFTTRCGNAAASTPTGGLFLDPSIGQIDGLVFLNAEWFENTGFGGYDGNASTSITFLACDFERTAASAAPLSGQGFYGKGSYTFTAPWFEANAAYGAYLDAGASALFTGGIFTGDSVQVAGIYAGCNTVTVLGAKFLGHTSGYSIENTFQNFVTWAACESADSTGFMNLGSGGVISTAASQVLGSYGAVIGGTNVQSGSGTAAFSATFGNLQPFTLTGNVTASSITSASAGQQVTIIWIQGAGGSHTYAWPANCKFTGGAAPTPSTTAGYQDSVTFWYDGTNWQEISRAVGVH